MKNRVLITITILLAFVAGGELTYLLFNNNNKYVDVDENSTVYNSCSNCMSGTMVVENGGIKATVDKIYDAVVMVKNFKNGSSNGSGSGFVYKVDGKSRYPQNNRYKDRFR